MLRKVVRAAWLLPMVPPLPSPACLAGSLPAEATFLLTSLMASTVLDLMVRRSPSCPHNSGCFTVVGVLGSNPAGQGSTNQARTLLGYPCLSTCQLRTCPVSQNPDQADEIRFKQEAKTQLVVDFALRSTDKGGWALCAGCVRQRGA